MSDSGMPTDEIARLIGHSAPLVTQAVYRKELRPATTTRAELIDHLVPINLLSDP